MKQSNDNRETLAFHSGSDILMSLQTSPVSFPVHWHTSGEMILALKDRCIFTVNNVRLEMNTGDLLIIWPGELHSIVETPEKATNVLQFDHNLLANCREINVNHKLLWTHNLVSQKNDPEVYPQIRQYFDEITEFYKGSDPFREIEIKIRILELLTLFTRHTLENRSDGVSAEDPDVSSENYLKIMDACDYMAQNCEEDLSQEKMADMMGFSRSYFSKLFKQYTQISFNEFVARQRVQRAISLFPIDSMSITDIAYQAGFQSIPNFNRVFKQYTGCSPSEYRRMYNSKHPPDL